MVDWASLKTPAAPPRNDLWSAFLIAGLFATGIVLIPFDGIWNDMPRLIVIGIASVVLAALTFAFTRFRAVTAVALVVISRNAVMAIEQSDLPEAFRGLGPQRIR